MLFDLEMGQRWTQFRIRFPHFFSNHEVIMKNLITISRLQAAVLLCLSVFACGNLLFAWPHGMLATGSEPGEYYFTANPFDNSIYYNYLFHVTGYNDSLSMPLDMEHTWKVWYDQGLDLLILRREYNEYEDSTFTFSWDGGITFEPGPSIYNSSFEVSLFPGESVVANSWSRDTLKTWEGGACNGLPSGGSTAYMQCTAWNPGETMWIYFNTAQDTHFVYHGWDYSDYFTLDAVTTDIPGCIYLTRGYSPGEMYSIYGDFIYRTTNYGQTWEWACDLYYQHTLPLDVFLESGWAPGELILMYHYNDLFEFWAEIHHSTDYASTWEVLYTTEELPVEDRIVTPNTSKLELSAHPNPFNDETEISFTLFESSEIELSVYDISGREVVRLAAGFRNPGSHTVNWKADAIPSGIYFVRLRAGNHSHIIKVGLVK